MIFQEFINKSLTPYHAVANGMEMLKSAGFTELPLSGEWHVEQGGKYYVDCYGSMLAAFRVGGEGELHIAAAHNDYPCLKLKPRAANASAGFVRLNIEPYGGLIFNTWLDRPLGLAGSAVIVDAAGKLKPVLIDFGGPVATIPNLAIHFNRDVNSGVEVKANRDLFPVCGLCGEQLSDSYIEERLAALLDVEPEAVLSYDLSFYLCEEGTPVGFDRELWLAPRLDNLTSSYACLDGIINTVRETGISAIMLYDNEEVGSHTKVGADSNITELLIEKLYCALGRSRSQLMDAFTTGSLLSCDVAHALHPNRPDMYDSECRSLMGKGLTLKLNFRQNYATDALAIAEVKRLCHKYAIPYGVFMNRPDLRGGGTISNDTASMLCMKAVDVGVPILAMHSACELMSLADEEALCSLCRVFL